MVRIERMTAGALGRGGVRGGRMTLLLRDALNGRARSRRALERAVGAGMTLVLPRDDAPCPLEFPNDERRRHGILVAPIVLGRGMRWEDDTLYGTFPETLAQAVVGRPLGDVLGHPDAEPLETTLPPRHAGGLLSVRRMTVDPPRPTPAQRLTHPWYRMRLLAEEGRMDGPAPLRYRLLQAALTAMVAVALAVGSWTTATVGGVVTAAAMTAAIAHGIWNVVNMSKARPFSMLRAMVAGSRHAAEMEEMRKARGEA